MVNQQNQAYAVEKRFKEIIKETTLQRTINLNFHILLYIWVFDNSLRIYLSLNS